MTLLSDLNSGIAIPRNPLYRKREVRLLLSVTGETLELVLTEVTSISQTSSGVTASLLGVIAATIQPWYFQPIVVEVAGKSYMGAYANDVLNVAADSDISKLMTLRQIVNEAFLLSRSSLKDLQVTLSIGDPRRNIPGVDQQLTGFVDDLVIDENQDDQYMMSYRFKFTGETAALATLRLGEERAQNDLQTATTIKTSDISATSMAQTPIPKAPLVGAEVPFGTHPTP